MCHFRSHTLTCSLCSRYKNYFECFELIDPAAPNLQANDEDSGAWYACHEICRRRELDYNKVRTDVLALRAYAPGFAQFDREDLKKNLLRWYYKGRAKAWPDLESFARCVFVMAFETVLAESLFSYLNLNKSGHRSRLTDEKVGAILHILRGTDAVDDSLSFFKDITFDSSTALKHDLPF